MGEGMISLAGASQRAQSTSQGRKSLTVSTVIFPSRVRKLNLLTADNIREVKLAVERAVGHVKLKALFLSRINPSPRLKVAMEVQGDFQLEIKIGMALALGVGALDVDVLSQ